MNEITGLILVYRSEDGTTYDRPATDVTDYGTLVDPETGEDMELVGWYAS